jgi:type I restriction enzyme S subunit
MEKKSLNASQKMKKTPAGEIPVDWSVVTIEKICNNVKDKVNSQFSPYIEIGDIDISRKNYLIKDKSSPIGAKLAKKGDIIISTVRPDRGAISKVRHDTAVSAAFVVLRDKGISDWEYVYQVLSQKKFFTRLGLLSTGSTYPTCDSSDILDFKFGLPTLLEQRKIAEILASIDLVIDHTQTIIDQTQILKKGLMQELFIRGIPGSHKKFKKTKIGMIPKEWEMVKLGDECAVTKLAGFEFTKFFKYKNDGEVIALRALNIRGEELDLSDVQTIDRSISDSLPRSKLYEGDVVLTYIGANIGDALRIPESNKYHLAPNIAKITPTGTYHSWFLLRVLQCDIVQRQIRLLTAITATPSLTMTQIRTIKVPKPSPVEQDNISQTISHVINRIKKEKKILEKMVILKSALMQVLLTGEARVGI